MNVNGTLFFVAMDPTGNRELWKSDGTEAGTVQVKDIRPGSAGSDPASLTNVNGTLHFVATDATGTSAALWKSDGTEAGTVMVLAVPFPPDQIVSTLVAVNGRVFLDYADAAGRELWTSDGTAAGTVRVKDIAPGAASSAPSSMRNVNGTLFFAATDGASGIELWKSDGTEAGTVPVRDINVGASGSDPLELTDVNGTLFFTAITAANGRELWKSNGTAAGTLLVQDIGPGPGSSNPAALARIGNLLYFRANDFLNGPEVWSTDGTAQNTLLFDLDDRRSSNPNSFTRVNGITFFAANDGVTGNELWKSDGTEAGTVLVRDIVPGGGGGAPTLLVAVGNTLFFTATDAAGGREIWKSDGTAAGTVRIKDVNPGSASSSPTALVAWGDQAGDRLYFVASDGVNNAALWKSDGTDVGTVRLGGSNLTQLRVAGPYLYMGAQVTPGFSGFSELWRSDSTSGGTIRLSDPNAFSGVLDFATGAAALDGAFYFAANGAGLGQGTELWKSDGTPAGTVLVKDIAPGFPSGAPTYLVRLGSALYFRANDPTIGTELWKTDGTAAGTVLVKDISVGTSSGNPQLLTLVNDVIFFAAFDATNGVELWKTDGTAAGTVLVEDINPGGAFSSPQLLTNWNGRLFFAARDFVHGQELWTSDGTPAGTFRVSDLFGPSDGAPQNLAASGNTLYFSALEPDDRGRQPWTVTMGTLTPTPTDSDGDGLPNTWESDFGLDPNDGVSDNGSSGNPDGDGRFNDEELEGGGHPRGFHRRYLAEGALNTFFDVRLALLNVGTAPAHLMLRYQQPGGAVLTQVQRLSRLRRHTITRADLTGLTSPDFSTLVESDQPIVLDRTMTWGPGGYGAHAETGVSRPSPTWYLAEGSTSGDFSLFYLLQNPNSFEVSATIRFLRPGGLPPIEREFELPPNSRTTIPVDTLAPELAETDVSAVITADNFDPIIVERAMYTNRPGQPFAAGHGSAGVTSPALEWFLAEGATGPFFDEFVLIANPGQTPAEVVAEYRLIGGGLLTKSYTVPANGRFTIWVDDEELPAGSGQKPLANVAVSTTIRSTNGVRVIAERAMWWPGPETTSNFWYEAHNSPGATTTGTKWALADGEAGGPSGYETYVLIANTSATSGQARVTLYFDDGTTAERTYDLAANSRTNVQVGPDFPAAANKRFGAVIESIGAAPVRIVVERAMYASTPDAVWSAGTNALATRLQ